MFTRKIFQTIHQNRKYNNKKEEDEDGFPKRTTFSAALWLGALISYY